MQLEAPVSERAIRDTMAAVFRQGPFAERRPSWVAEKLALLWDWFWNAVAALFRPLGGLRAADGPAYWALVITVIVVLLAIIGRLAYVSWLRRSQGIGSRPGYRTGGGHASSGDPWLRAQALAAQGNFTDAAHALYLALLEAIARGGGVKLHPSKTAGDYVRELRSRSSALFSRFRDFARAYEFVVYGTGACDQERYERLHALALPIMKPDG